MNILAIADSHIKAKPPRKRTSDFHELQHGKMLWCLATAREFNSILVIAGDLFNSALTPYWVVNEYIRLFISYPSVPVFAVYGQHDLRYHNRSGIQNTPIKTLEEAGCITLLGEDPIVSRGVRFYGAGWKCPVPKVQHPKLKNVLVMHKMVTKRKLWKSQDDSGTKAELYFDKYKQFKWIITGDNHSPFVLQTNPYSDGPHRALINPGSVVRLKDNQIRHKPRAYFINTNTNEITKEFIPIKPGNEVFNLREDEESKSAVRDMSRLVSKLHIKVKTTSFKSILRKVVKEAKPPKPVLQIFKEKFDELSETTKKAG